MALNGFLTLDGMKQGQIVGESMNKEYADWITVYGTEHMVEIPKDPQSGMPTGQRRHSPFTIIKAVDLSSPLLCQACANGEQMKKWLLHYLQINEQGQELLYYSIALENAIVTKIRHYKPHVLQEQTKNLMDMEEVSFSYTKIIWNHQIGNKEASDDWRDRG